MTVHVEPYGDGYRVFVRIDEVWGTDKGSLSTAANGALIALEGVLNQDRKVLEQLRKVDQ